MMSCNVSRFSLAALVALSAGCGGKGNAGPSAPASAATPYAGIFVERAAATYHYTSKSEMNDPDDPKADANGNVVEESASDISCATTTRTVDGWQVAEITCGGELGSGVVDDLATTFVAGPAGLYRLEAGETFDAAALATRTPLLAARPVPVAGKAPTEDERFGTSHSVQQAGLVWCVEDAAWGGDESGTSICIHAERGITSLTRYWAGGSSREESLELQD